MKPEIVRSIARLREEVAGWRSNALTVGMVPTMGALHEGHLALVRQAQQSCDRVVVTLFVNPAQFGPTEDLGKYPRSEDADHAKLASVAADLLFTPGADEMYPDGFQTEVVVGGPASDLESDFRPHFFSGVATIVAKLLLAGLPDRAFFGEKDYQQLLVVKTLVRDLNIPTEIVGCPTVREPDGLALSSRNTYLSDEERRRAPQLHAILSSIAAALRSGHSIANSLADGRQALQHLGFRVDYLELRNAETLALPAEARAQPLRLLVAAWLGATRLIDNIAV